MLLESNTYQPKLIPAGQFEISKEFDCRQEMVEYKGNKDFHSLMHNVQKKALTSNKVDILSYFANKVLLIEWLKDLVPLQKTFAFSTKLNNESEIKRLFQIIQSKVESHEEFIVKPINGSESIGTLKVFLNKGIYIAEFLGSSKQNNNIQFSAKKVISEYNCFSQWIKEKILGITSGSIDTHLLHIEPGLIIQALFPHDKDKRGPIEMKFNTAWGELLYVGCRNAQGVCLDNQGDYLEGERETAKLLKAFFFEELKTTALSLARASTYPNLRFDFFVEINTGVWVLNEIETLADCRSYPDYILENTGKFYHQGWLNKSYKTIETKLTTRILRERLIKEFTR